jgi:hypothetical protein
MKALVIRMHLQKGKRTNDDMHIEFDKDQKLFGELNTLPDEILVKVCSYLKQKDLLNVAPVSKKWNILANDRLNWTKLSFKDWNSKCMFHKTTRNFLF